MNLNTVTLEGNLTADPQLVHVSGGVTAVVEAVVLVNRRIKDSDGEWSDAEPTRHRIKAFNTLAQNIAALPKGARVLVVGHIETDTWTDKTSGDKRTADTVIIDALGASLRYNTVAIGPQAASTEGN